MVDGPTGGDISRTRALFKEVCLPAKNNLLIQVTLILWLTFRFNHDSLAFFYKAVLKRSSLYFTAVVAVF